MYCKDCLHYTEFEGFGIKKHHACDKVGYSDVYHDLDGNEFELYADALDDTDLTCDLFVGPMFGCVHFTQKQI